MKPKGKKKSKTSTNVLPAQKKDLPWSKNDILTVAIDDISGEGLGIGHVYLPQSSTSDPNRSQKNEETSENDRDGRGYTLFVKDALIGDTVTCSITKAKKHYAFARLIDVIHPSPYRVTPPCPVARKCGGCQIQALDYVRQLQLKENIVRNDLIRIGGFDETLIRERCRPVIGMEEPYRYRNKAQFPVGEADGHPIAGFYAGRTHSIIPIDDCLIGAEENAVVMKTILAWMEKNKIRAYREESGEGLIRHVLIRKGYYSEQIMVCLVINGKNLPKQDELIQKLSKIPGMTSISISINTEKTNVIMGNQVRTLWGTDSIEDSLQVYDVERKRDLGSDAEADPANEDIVPLRFHKKEDAPIRFGISPLSFYQVNPKQTQRLYSIALDFAGLTGNEIVWDLYCGVGTISLFMARYAKSVFGVEIVPDAIRDARLNAERNHITNAYFEVGKAEEVVPAYVREHNLKEGDIDVVVVDPPRKGCDEKCLETILQVAPKRIVYVSCDPATLARDLKFLTGEGKYSLEEIQPTDMFGHSCHVETVALLSKKA